MKSHPIESRVVVGLLIWAGLLGGGGLLARHLWVQSPNAARQLLDYTTRQRFTIPIEFENPQVLRRGDLVFIAGDPAFNPIGYISQVDSANPNESRPVETRSAFLTFYGGAPAVGKDDILHYHRTEDTTEWVLQTMLPPKKRKEIGNLIVAAYKRHQSDIVDAIRPIVEDSLREASDIIKSDLAAAFSKRNESLQNIGARYRIKLIEKRLVPLLQNEIWPIVQDESQELAEKIGGEIWQEVSLFRFGWRYLIDKSPLPADNLAENEFKRFMEQKAVPILKNHVKELVHLQQTILRRVSENEKVRDTVSSAVKDIVNDPEIQNMFTDVFREVFVNNVKLNQSMENHWRSPKARAALDLTNQRLEPTINEIGIILFGSPDIEITPEFARVLRQRILHRDSRWFTIEFSGEVQHNRRPVQRPTKLIARPSHPDGNIPYAPARDRR